MYKWLKAEVELSRPPKGSDTPLRDHLEQVFKTTGVKPPALAAQPPFPEDLRHLLDWWNDMRGDGVLTFTEIHHWSALTRRHLTALEVDVVHTLDRIYWRT